MYIRFLSVSQTAATATATAKTTTTAFRQRVVCKTSQQRYHNANNKHDGDGNNNTRTVLCFKRKIRLAPLKDQTRTRIAKAQALKAEISTFKKKPKKSHETKVNKGPNVEPKDDHELPCSIKEMFVIIKRLLKRCSRFLTLERKRGRHCRTVQNFWDGKSLDCKQAPLTSYNRNVGYDDLLHSKRLVSLKIPSHRR